MKNYKLSAIIWLIVSVIWVGLTIGKIAEQDSIWSILLNAVVAALSIANVVLNFINWKKNK
ncbi:MAG: hypothetical protein IJX55_03160 [Clostridia bacterium]|nr:hypothetical protein [Clostridia bacterium]